MQDIKRRASREQACARNPLAKLNFKGTFGLKTDLQSGYNGRAFEKKERKNKGISERKRTLLREHARCSNVSPMRAIFEGKWKLRTDDLGFFRANS